VTRPTWDETWLNVADIVGKRSRCSRAQVGAVIVGRDQRIVATGYNGPPSGMMLQSMCENWCPRAKHEPQGSDYSDCVSIHAELNALMYVDRSRCEGGTLYVNSAMCWGCAKAVSNSGIYRVVMVVHTGEEYRQPDLSADLLRSSRLEVTVLHD
jgi:dCMP deaminase